MGLYATKNIFYQCIKGFLPVMVPLGDKFLPTITVRQIYMVSYQNINYLKEFCLFDKHMRWVYYRFQRIKMLQLNLLTVDKENGGL